MPASLKELVERRLRGLSKRARDLLEVASVLGHEMDRALLAAVAGADDDTIDDAIGQLVVRQILDAESGVFRFAHDKLRETTYAGIPEARRLVDDQLLDHWGVDDDGLGGRGLYGDAQADRCGQAREAGGHVVLRDAVVVHAKDYSKARANHLAPRHGLLIGNINPLETAGYLW